MPVCLQKRCRPRAAGVAPDRQVTFEIGLADEVREHKICKRTVVSTDPFGNMRTWPCHLGTMSLHYEWMDPLDQGVLVFTYPQDMTLLPTRHAIPPHERQTATAKAGLGKFGPHGQHGLPDNQVSRAQLIIRTLQCQTKLSGSACCCITEL